MFITILGIILFAVATMIIYSWGYVKEQRAPYELAQKLNKKAEKKIMDGLRCNDFLTIKEITKLLKGLKVSNFGSRKKLVVEEPKKLSKSVLNNMVEKGTIEVKYKGKECIYLLKNID